MACSEDTVKDIYRKLTASEVDRAVLREKMDNLDAYMHERNHDILNEIQKVHGTISKHIVDEAEEREKFYSTVQAQERRIKTLEDAKLAAKSAWWGAKTGVALTFAAIGAAVVLLITKVFGIKL